MQKWSYYNIISAIDIKYYIKYLNALPDSQLPVSYVVAVLVFRWHKEILQNTQI